MVTVRVTLQEVINAPAAVINDTTNKVNKNRFIEFHLSKITKFAIVREPELMLRIRDVIC